MSIGLDEAWCEVVKSGPDRRRRPSSLATEQDIDQLVSKAGLCAA